MESLLRAFVPHPIWPASRACSMLQKNTKGLRHGQIHPPPREYFWFIDEKQCNDVWGFTLLDGFLSMFPCLFVPGLFWIPSGAGILLAGLNICYWQVPQTRCRLGVVVSLLLWSRPWFTYWWKASVAGFPFPLLLGVECWHCVTVGIRHAGFLERPARHPLWGEQFFRQLKCFCCRV